MDLPPILDKKSKKNRMIEARMLCGDTEIRASAMDVVTQQSVRVNIDFLNESNPKYQTKL